MRRRYRTWALAYAFVAPTVVLTVAFSLVPLAMLLWRSLYGGGVFDTYAVVQGIEAATAGGIGVRSLQDMHAALKKAR